MEISKETIMPDGRPFYAWENEMIILRRQEPNLIKGGKELSDLWRILKVVKIETCEESDTRDILIRVKRSDGMREDFQWQPEKYFKIERGSDEN